VQETRRYDEASGKTVRMRLKSDAVDYKYFCEPNITPIKLSDDFVDEAIKTCPELYDAKENVILRRVSPSRCGYLAF
jgi:aspartyl-tRNA(Asn)/glutamyl-tRNA(Gln) amidotransferase subunit B